MLKQLAFLEGTEDRESFFRRVYRFAPQGSAGAELIEKAYDAAEKAFDETYRASGERSFEHCRGVAIILMDVVGVTDAETIAAALLHDIIEDCRRKLGWRKELIEQKCGPAPAFLVDAVTMPEGDFPDRDARIAAYHAQVVKAAARDVRVLLVKLADRYHNLCTLDSLRREKQARMVKETEIYYLPLAKEHGILYRELTEILAYCKKTLRRVPRERRKN